LVEMLRAGEVDATVVLAKVPLMDGLREVLALGIFSSLQPQNVRLRRAIRNLDAVAGHPLYPALFDPQTAGGLLASLPREQAEACLESRRAQGYAAASLIGSVGARSGALAPITIELVAEGSTRTSFPPRAVPTEDDLEETRHAHQPVL